MQFVMPCSIHFGLASCSSGGGNKATTPSFGLDMNASEVVYANTDERAGGERYQITVYKLNEHALFNFLRLTTKGNYPKQQGSLQTKTWQKAPLGTDETQVMDMLSSYDPVYEAWGTYRNNTQQALKANKAFYAYHYASNGSYLTHLTFYLIEPKNYTLTQFDYQY